MGRMFKVNLISALLACALLSSCALTRDQKRANRATRQVKKEMKRHTDKMDELKDKWGDVIEINPTQVRIDTVIPPARIIHVTKRDTVVEQEIVEHFIRDTLRTKEFIRVFYEATKDSVAIDTAGVQGYVTGSNLNVNIIKAEQTISVTADCPDEVVTKQYTVTRNFWQDWKFWVLIAILVVGWIFRKVIAAYVKSIRPPWQG